MGRTGYFRLSASANLEKIGPENVFDHTTDAIRSIDAPHGHEAHPPEPLVEGAAAAGGA